MRPLRAGPRGFELAATVDIRVGSLRDSMARRTIVTQ
jgi:hypothetical protein